MQHVTGLSHFLPALVSELWLSESAPFVTPQKELPSYNNPLFFTKGSVALHPPYPLASSLPSYEATYSTDPDISLMLACMVLGMASGFFYF